MRKYALLAFIVFIFFLDRFTKVLIIKNLAMFESVRVTSFFSIVHTRNFGGVFGFLNQHQYAKYIFIFLPLLIVAVLIYFIVTSSAFAKTLSLTLILAGALGNIYDRLAYGNVVDFLDFHYRVYHWYAFNVADISICCGIGLWLYAELFGSKQKVAGS